METIIYKPLNSVWLKASVVGSLWASVEILLGSFLHNLKIPLSGTILSFISVYLLISFFQIWKERGLILRSGLICALMKSISPSAIILGPMIGIITEAALLELFILLFGRNLIGYMVGGAFAVLSALLHKLLSLLILYGFDFLKILSALYKFLIIQINQPNLNPVSLLIIVTSFYFVTGLVAAVAGYIKGRSYVKSIDLSSSDKYLISLQTHNKLFSDITNQKYSVYYLVANIVAIVTSLFLINSDQVIFSVIFSLLYISICVFHYKAALNRFRNFSVWIQFGLITIVTAFLWNSISGNLFSISGLIIGLKMITRAIIVIIGFAAISNELKNPLIKSVLYKRGFTNLYQSVSLAFSALPGILSNLNGPENKIKKSGFLSIKIFKQAEYLLHSFEKEHLLRSQIVILTGELHQGKTTFAKKIVEDLQNTDYKVGGFLSLGLQDADSRTGFDLYDIERGELFDLCRKEKKENWLKYGRYYFNPEGLSKGNEILSIDRLSKKDVIIIDEIGPLELGGKGWSSAIENVCRNSLIPQVWIVRKSLVTRVTKKWNIGNVYIFKIREATISDVSNLLISLIGSDQRSKTTK